MDALLTCSLVVGSVRPIPTLPDASTRNGVESGFAWSSTIRALPVPPCDILTKSVVDDPDAIISGEVAEFPKTMKVVPS